MPRKRVEKPLQIESRADIVGLKWEKMKKHPRIHSPNFEPQTACFEPHFFSFFDRWGCPAAFTRPLHSHHTDRDRGSRSNPGRAIDRPQALPTTPPWLRYAWAQSSCISAPRRKPQVRRISGACGTEKCQWLRVGWTCKRRIG